MIGHRSPLLSITSTMSYSIFCMGNPLLDLQVTGGEKLLEKYELEPNGAILAGEKQSGMFVLFTFVSFFQVLIRLYSYEEVVRDYQVTYVAGGAAQNAARGAAVRACYRISFNVHPDQGFQHR